MSLRCVYVGVLHVYGCLCVRAKVVDVRPKEVVAGAKKSLKICGRESRHMCNSSRSSKSKQQRQQQHKLPQHPQHL
ncbi:hypothetical protein M5D96_001676 [Drosophila gunungcola]|uniref:Secreted protein n=1 Tax=Drosophila gunungcola TaxID=103775 RepID=A0A9P9YZE5_9MUSC|nr:hypothetical protein M5D96_001676 [Drosophila gunungcola]